MRVTPFMILAQLQRAMQKTADDFANVDNQLATGKKISKPSDDVAGMMQVMDYTLAIGSNDQYESNITAADTKLNVTAITLSSVSDTLSKISEFAQNAAPGMTDPVQKDALVQNISNYRDMLLSLANSTYGDNYLFAGFKSDQAAYDPATYAYQGDSGINKVAIDKGTYMQTNIPGSTAFSYTLSAPDSVPISGGKFVHYTQGAGSAINVEIRDTDDTTVLDNFSFSNFIQMTDLLGTAVSSGNSLRVGALQKPLNNAVAQSRSTQADIAFRLNTLAKQATSHTNKSNVLKDGLSKVADADMTESAVALQKLQTTLQALQMTTSKMLSQSLLDYLK